MSKNDSLRRLSSPTEPYTELDESNGFAKELKKLSHLLTANSFCVLRFEQQQQVIKTDPNSNQMRKYDPANVELFRNDHPEVISKQGGWWLFLIFKIAKN
jgi:hypothetical protein